MLRSLFTAISGLDTHQQMLDITANNIANVNTVGFKASSAIFEDALSQTLAGGGSATTGGGNPVQVGLGVVLASSNVNFTQGAPQATGVPSNLYITGDGFFQVEKNGQTMFTRAGAFTLDSAGHLETPDGAIVDDSTGNPLVLSGLVPTAGPPAAPALYSSYSIDSTGTVTAKDSSGVSHNLGQVGLATFANNDGLVKSGDNEYLPSPASGPATIGAPGSGSAGTLSSGYLEMSNVDLSQELTNLIVAERGFQANSKVVTTSDEVLQTLVNLKQ
jgi:flagellar hook protein FlgE